MNSYTTKDWLIIGFISLVLQKNFILQTYKILNATRYIDIFKSRKWGTSFSYKSTVNFKFLSKLFSNLWIQLAFHSFDRNLKFLLDWFKNNGLSQLGNVTNGISIYWNDSNTRLYMNYTSFVPWTHHTAWIRSLVTRAFAPFAVQVM